MNGLDPHKTLGSQFDPKRKSRTYMTAYNRFKGWSGRGIWKRIFHTLVGHIAKRYDEL